MTRLFSAALELLADAEDSGWSRALVCAEGISGELFRLFLCTNMIFRPEIRKASHLGVFLYRTEWAMVAPSSIVNAAIDKNKASQRSGRTETTCVRRGSLFTLTPRPVLVQDGIEDQAIGH